ncbi:hypothetical protein BSPWISOX_2750 [uncultured Gammaproteobacteria bacterium]|nr:hypothetical protein BSPWISOX_2750 [uncultured Gammaproteobacteria bacterium]
MLDTPWNIKTNATPVSVAGCLGYDVLGHKPSHYWAFILVSVAGCLGYDVLVAAKIIYCTRKGVSVAGCLGYDVLVYYCW